MFQIVNQTRDEKIAMYMKTPKKALVEMLMANQDLAALCGYGSRPRLDLSQNAFGAQQSSGNAFSRVQQALIRSLPGLHLPR